MKNLYRSLIVISFMIFGFAQNSNASHVAGVDINYVCVGQDSFLVTLNIFRDCSGIPAPTNPDMQFVSSCGSSFSQNLTLQNPGGTEVSQLCATSIVNSTCNGGLLPGMQQYIYTTIVVLSPQCNFWTMSWDECCRNTTVNLVGGPNMYVEATMYSGTDTCNNSPVFNAQPIPYVCINQVVNYNFGVTEPDGDSFVYSFTAPLINPGAPVTFAAGYSIAQPLPGIVLNQTSGQLTFTPTVLGKFVLAVQVCEYDYGTGLLLGCVTRDIQFVVQNCTNSQPVAPVNGISNFQGTGVQIGPDSVEVCVGNYFSFDLVYSDPDPTDSLTLTTNIATVLPGATVTVVNGNPATITVGWIAQPGTPAFNSFTVTAVDDACPTPGIAFGAYTVIVVPSTYAGPDLTICQGTQWAQLGATGGSIFNWIPISGSMTMDTVPTSPGYNATCQNCQNPSVSPAVTTAYMVVSNLSGTCVNIDTVIVNVAPNFNLTMPNDTLICSVDDYPLVLSTDEPGFTYTYQWSPSGSLDFDTVETPIANPIDPTLYRVTVTAAGGCVKRGDVFIDLSPPFPGNMEIIGDTVLCFGSTSQFDVDFGPVPVGSCALTSQGCVGNVQDGDLGTGTGTNTANTYPAVYGGQHWGAKHQVLYRASELSNMGMGAGGFINSISFFVNTVSTMPAYQGFTIRIGCTSALDMSTGWINPNDMYTVYYSPNYTASTGWNLHNFTQSYKWDGSSNLVVEVCFNSVGSGNNAIMPFTPTGYQSVLYQVGNTSSICSTTSPVGGGATTSNKRPNTRFNYCSGVDPNALTFSWTPTAGVTNPLIHNPVVFPQVSTTYQLIVADTFGGCTDTLTHFIDVVTEFDAGFSFDDPYCVSSSPDTAVVNVGNGYFTGTGIDSAGVFSPGVAGIGVHPITYHIPLPTLCANDSTINVSVIPLPDASVTNVEVCRFSDTLTLVPVTPGGVYSGTGIIDPVNGVFDPDTLAYGSYQIVYTLTTPCLNMDTSIVKIIQPYNFNFNSNSLTVCQDATVDVSGNYTLLTGTNMGSGPVLAIWSDMNGHITSSGVFDATGLAAGDYTVQLSVTGMDGSCGNSHTMIITVLNIDYPTFPDDLVYCDDEKSAIVTVVPRLFGTGTFFTQTPLGSLGANDTLDIVQFGSNGKFDASASPIGSWQIEVSYTNLNNCTGVSTDTIHVLETPEAPTVIEDTYCEGEDINLSAIGNNPDSMYWYNDINELYLVGVGSPTYWGVAPDPSDGPVYVWVTENNWKCVSPKVKYELPIKEAPDASFTMNYRDTLGNDLYSVPNTSSPIYGFNPMGVVFNVTNAQFSDSVWWNHHAELGADPSWINDANTPDVGFTYSIANYFEGSIKGGVYVTRVIVTNEFGCADTAEAYFLSVGTEEYYNIFTPNGDGVNDVFYVNNTSLEFFKVEIFNRWGSKVYEWENDPTHGWDGGSQPDGVYFWTLIGTYTGGEEFQKQGTVTISGRK